MELSHDLISQFAKLVTKDNKPTVDTTVYGTVIEDANGNKYVKLDGSDQLTPLSDDKRPSADSTTVKTDVGDRVAVSIKNHTATVTGNVSSPAAKNGDVENLGKQVSEVKEFDVVLAEQVQANAGYIKQLQTDKAEVGELRAAEAEIEKLETNKASIGQLEAAEAEIENLKTTKIDADVADLKYAEIKDLDATNAKINALDAEHGSFETLVTNKFVANDAAIANLQTNSLTAEKADIAYAKIDFSNMIGVKINEAAIEHLFASSGMVKDITIDNGVITGELIGVTLKGDLVEAGTLKADRLVVKGENGIYYKLNIEGGAVASAEVTKEQLQNGLSGSVIIAKSITAEKVSVSDLVAFGATIGGFQITDDSIHSVTKPTVSATTRGFYVDNDGQFNVGDSTNFVKFFKDTDGTYKLRISADSIVLGSSEVATKQDLSDIEIGGTNLLINSSFKEDLDEWNQVFPSDDNSILNVTQTASGRNAVTVVGPISQEQNSATVKLESANLLNLASVLPIQLETVTNDGNNLVFTNFGSKHYGCCWNNVPLEVGKTYTFSIKSISYHDTQWGWRFKFADGTYSTASQSATMSLTLSQKVTQVLFYAAFGAMTTTQDITIEQPMINEGSTALTYTSYVDVGGVAVEACGRNLFNPQWLLDWGATKSGDYYAYKLSASKRLPLTYKENTRYTFELKGYNATKTSSTMCIYVVYTDGTSDYGAYLSKTSESKCRFTTDLGKTVSRISVTYANSDTVYIKDVTLYEDLTYDPYEPYTGATYFAGENGMVTITDPISPHMNVISKTSGVNVNLTYKLRSGFVTETGKPCLNIKHLSFGETKSLSQSLLGKLEPNKDYTVSCSVLLKNVENGPTNPSFSYQLSGAYDNSGVETYWGRGSRNFDKLTDIVCTPAPDGYILDPPNIWDCDFKSGYGIYEIASVTPPVYYYDEDTGEYDYSSIEEFGKLDFTDGSYVCDEYEDISSDEWSAFVPGQKLYYSEEDNVLYRTVVSNDTWQRVVWSFNTDDMPELLRLSLFLYTRDMTGDLYLCDLKLEKGNKATDWSPAPEDAENDLADAVNDIRLEMTRKEAYILEEADGITMSAINDYAKIAESQYYTKSEAATLKTEADNITASIKNVEQTIKDGEFTQVKIRETNFKMDIEGLTIEVPNSSAEHNISTTISNNGMVVKSNGVSKLTADASGVDAADLHASTYLIVGVNSRFEDYNNQTRTACFWIGK